MGIALLRLPSLILEEIFKHLEFHVLFYLSATSSNPYLLGEIGAILLPRYKIKLSYESSATFSTLNERNIFVHRKLRGRRVAHRHHCYRVNVVTYQSVLRANDCLVHIAKTPMIAKIGYLGVMEVSTFGTPAAYWKFVQHFMALGFRKPSLSIQADEKTPYVLNDALVLMKKFKMSFKTVSLSSHFANHGNKEHVSRLTQELGAYLLRNSEKLSLCTDLESMPIDVQHTATIRKLFVTPARWFNMEKLLAFKNCEKLQIFHHFFTSEQMNGLMVQWTKEKTPLKMVDFGECLVPRNEEVLLQGLEATPFRDTEENRMRKHLTPTDNEYKITRFDGSTWLLSLRSHNNSVVLKLLP